MVELREVRPNDAASSLGGDPAGERAREGGSVDLGVLGRRRRRFAPQDRGRRLSPSPLALGRLGGLPRRRGDAFALGSSRRGGALALSRLPPFGERERLDRKLNDKILSAEALTADNTGLRLQVAVAYGGRWDIVEAARSVAGKVVAGEIDAESIDEGTFAAELQLGGIPDPDLLIRTGGEQRISNFLLWNLAYAELWFTDILWPDFGEAEFESALEFYSRRQRRYGHTGEQLEAVKC